MKCTRIYFNFTLIAFLCICNSYSTNPFDDTILYNIKWPGRDLEDIMEIMDPDNFEVGVTDQQERYVCFLPAEVKPKDEDSDSKYSEVDPIQLLKPLFDQSTCSYRLESYWAYEVCHGKFIKQYHEERDGKKMKRQEYYLGKVEAFTFDDISVNFKETLRADSNAIKTKKIEGMDIPYFQLNYTDGTLCDLNEQPRQTNVLYMCFNSARHDIYSIKEVSTCLYEAIIFTPYLCSHPLYRPKNSAEKDINCTPFDQESKKPTALMAMEAESLKQKHEQLIDDEQVLKKVFAVFSFDKSDQVDLLSLMDDELEGEARVHFHIHPIDVLPEIPAPKPVAELPRKPDVNYDVASFLSGDNCLEDGKGWWKYEFCYGKHVIQYHEQPDGSKNIIKLGTFSLEDHRKWIENNPLKNPKKKSTSISHFYSKGSFCQMTGNPRETEVRFKCIKESASLSTIKLYMVEPQTCKYVLSVESQLFCKLIPHIDEDGMFKNVKISNDIDEHIEL